jgi:hypothetical protein
VKGISLLALFTGKKEKKWSPYQIYLTATIYTPFARFSTVGTLIF